MPHPNRRTALKTIATTGLTIPLASNLFTLGTSPRKTIRLGMIADLHGGLAVDAAKRLDAFLESMATLELDGLVQLGDFAFPNQQHQEFADKFNAAHETTIHVIGNHEFDFGLTRDDCFKAWGIEAAYYRQDIEGIRILVLDGNEKGSPSYTSGYHSYIGKQQQQWLLDELEAADRPVVILSHQPLAGESAIDNAQEIHKLLAPFRDKIAVCINGHSHVDSLLIVDGVTYLHLNSASYYWVGGEKRMAYYQAALFATLTIDLAKSQITIEGRSTQWKPDNSPRTLNYVERDSSPPETIVVPAIRDRTISNVANGPIVQTNPLAEGKKPDKSLKVMTWNIWGRLNQEPRYTLDDKTARRRTIEIIRDSGADIVAMIETYGSASDIAEALGFHYYTPSKDANLCLFSRFPLSDFGTPEGLSAFSFIAATATLPDGQKIRLYDIWLTSSGRHIVKIKDKSLSDQDFCDGDDVRFTMLEKFLQHAQVQKDMANAEVVPLIVAGDFNCVSHLDHTQATRHSKLNHSRVLNTKVSKAMYHAGFDDSYRDANPDVLDSTLGHTWTTVGMGFVYESDKGFVPVEKNPEPVDFRVRIVAESSVSDTSPAEFKTTPIALKESVTESPRVIELASNAPRRPIFNAADSESVTLPVALTLKLPPMFDDPPNCKSEVERTSASPGVLIVNCAELTVTGLIVGAERETLPSTSSTPEKVRLGGWPKSARA
jgi:predicted phosphodiesterase/exonuclease III